MSDDFYPWLEPVRKQWLALISANRVPHAVLLRGVPGSGRRMLAGVLARDMLCETEGIGPGQAACGKCAGCQLLSAGNHPDLYSLKPDGQYIKVAHIRAMTAALTLSAHRNGRKVAIVESAGCMNAAAANALLKTLEEPSDNACLILISDESDQLLPTITSRCQIISIPLPEAWQVADWLRRDDEVVPLALVLAGGAPLLARKWLENGRLTRFMGFLDDMASLLSGGGAATASEIVARWSDSLTAQWLAALNRYLLHLKQVRLGLRPALAADETWLTRLKHHLDDEEKMCNVTKHLGRLTRYLDSVLKKELLLEEFLINWQKK